MADDQQDTLLPLGNASVVLQPGHEKRRFKVDTATLIPRGKHRVRLVFEGPEGSVVINLARTTFWRLTSLFHEQSIAADYPGPKKPKSSRKRS